MVVLHLTEPPPRFSMDGDLVNALLYSLAFHIPRNGASLHGVSVAGHRMRVVFTASRRARDALVRAVSRDAVGYVAARFGGPPSVVDVEDLVALPNAQTQAEALARVAIEGGLGALV